MSKFEALILCLVFASISLVVVSYANRRQTRGRLLRQKLEQMKRRINELEEISILIEPLVDSKSILIYVLNELVELINKTKNLDRANQQLETNLTAAEERLDQLHANRVKPGLWRIQNSDAAIARARYALNQTGRILRKRQALGELELEELHSHITELSWAHSMVAVITLVSQAHQAMNRGDVLKAFAYYKSAQQMLIQSTPASDKRHQFIREISEILANERKTISPNLMPEKDYDPNADNPSISAQGHRNAQA